jgi:hypothetical protein
MQAQKEKEQREYALEMAKMENQRYIAVINNMAKLMTSDKQIDASILNTLLAGVQKEKQSINKGENNE